MDSCRVKDFSFSSQWRSPYGLSSYAHQSLYQEDLFVFDCWQSAYNVWWKACGRHYDAIPRVATPTHKEPLYTFGTPFHRTTDNMRWRDGDWCMLHWLPLALPMTWRADIHSKQASSCFRTLPPTLPKKPWLLHTVRWYAAWTRCARNDHLLTSVSNLSLIPLLPPSLGNLHVPPSFDVDYEGLLPGDALRVLQFWLLRSGRSSAESSECPPSSIFNGIQIVICRALMTG